MKIIGLDVGTKRIGVAKADSKVKIALANGYLKVDGTEMSKLIALARTYGVDLFVVGLPRSNDGNETRQSLYARNFARALNQALPEVRVVMQDESLTSVEAEERLKMRGRPYEKGDIDAEAATIILQDFLERAYGGATGKAASKAAVAASDTASDATKNTPSPASPENPENPKAADAPGERIVNLVQPKPEKSPKQKRSLRVKIVAWILIFLMVFGGGAAVAYYFYNQPVDQDCAEACTEITFTVSEGQSTADIAGNLFRAGLVRNQYAFLAYYFLNYNGQSLKAGEYTLNNGMRPGEIIEALVAGPQADVFSFTFLPGATIFDFEEQLLEYGYDATEIEAALNATYDHPVLAGKPDDASLEGYLFGETYEFYTGESVENIILTMLDELYSVVQENDLENLFAAQGLTLYEGITLASIVQKEANNYEDYRIVAQVFYSRLDQGIALGSDITVQYALDLVDPDRTTYTTNATALTIDSPYNTRLYTGLPPGPVSNPGVTALIATANPADTSYLFFLTGDDGSMYYSYTDAEHEENIANYCQVLCSVGL